MRPHAQMCASRKMSRKSRATRTALELTLDEPLSHCDMERMSLKTRRTFISRMILTARSMRIPLSVRLMPWCAPLPPDSAETLSSQPIGTDVTKSSGNQPVA